MGKEVYCSSSRTLSERSVLALGAEVAPRTACVRSCDPGMCRPMCEGRSMRAGVQRARSREVFGCEPGECMGAVYSRTDRRLSTRMHRECMGREYARGQRVIDTDTF